MGKNKILTLHQIISGLNTEQLVHYRNTLLFQLFSQLVKSLQRPQKQLILPNIIFRQMKT